jgi:hypothetical protein
MSSSLLGWWLSLNAPEHGLASCLGPQAPRVEVEVVEEVESHKYKEAVMAPLKWIFLVSIHALFSASLSIL